MQQEYNLAKVKLIVEKLNNPELSNDQLVNNLRDELQYTTDFAKYLNINVYISLYNCVTLYLTAHREVFKIHSIQMIEYMLKEIQYEVNRL